ncbi:MAG: EamA family transporter [Oscillochloris sp.]|nr:EamA family transporter [Oscillochloris sp.]
MHPSSRTGYALAITAALVWAATGPGLSYVLNVYQIPPLALAFWRDAFVALACLSGLLVAGRGRLPRMNRGDLGGFAVMGTISVGIYHALFVTSIALNGAAMGIVLIYLYPAIVSLGAWLIFKEHIEAQQILALLLAILGCVLLVRAYDPEVLRVSWVGVLVGVGSAVTHAGYVLFSQRAVSRHSPWLSLGMTMTFGALTLLVLNLFTAGPAILVTAGTSPAPWLSMLALALGPTLGGYAAFTISLRHIPGRIASLLVVIEAPLATLISVLLLKEHFVPIQALGMAFVLFAAVLPGIPLRVPRRVPVVGQPAA